ncbi:ATP phosphoribosyltransferase regulatory subunit [Gracilibacillus ureilyticus]|uniref:ATP phosphoribosyltransferase regulatory subunit n=1 Tax=Gracilibacillus ureilyticus TaxID=531814 RepID=A0A1H9LF63_9BACI|nr:ATP phosphoribosyltransferase regulatory subunit [Gracilibacillus ureilyticus]SER09847.1 ATP phosphoribosyltransferase regulatory subunit [Gracilibacillus ureilyticus]
MFLPAGSQDETGVQIANRLKASEIFRKVTEKRNFKAISTPVVEYAHTFTNKIAGMDLQSMLKWFNSEGEIEVLRPDWTAAVARAIAKQHPSFQKWAYQGSVFRIDKDGTESRQAGIEIVHADPFLGESECLLTAVDYLKNIDINNYVIELGHTRIFEQMIAPLQLNQKEEEALRSAMYDKRMDLVEDLLINHSSEIKQDLVSLIDAYGGKEVISQYEIVWADQPELLSILDHIRKLIELLESTGLSEIIVDLGRVKNLPYYDGIMFRGFITKDGSTCFSGGRYDRLYRQFEQETSAVGLAFDVDLLAQHMITENSLSRGCIIAAPETHAIAEKYRSELPEDIVDIQYKLENEAVYHTVYEVIRENNQYKVVRK